MPSRTALTALAAAAAGAALPALYATALRTKLRSDATALMEGNPGPLLSAYADDATLTFPGASSWGREYRGKREIEGFVTRFLAAGIRGEAEQIVVNGPPWNMTVAVRFNDWAKDLEGNTVYTNRAVLFARVAWGKIKQEEVYEDTEKATAFDDYLNSVGAPAAVS